MKSPEENARCIPRNLYQCYTVRPPKDSHERLYRQSCENVALEYTKPKSFESSPQRGQFLNFDKGPQSKAFQHNRQSCPLRTLARWMGRKNRTYHRTNPARRAPAADWKQAQRRPFKSWKKTNLDHAIMQSSLKLRLYIVLSTISSIFFQSDRLWMNLYTSYIYPISTNWIGYAKGRRDDWLLDDMPLRIE